MIKVHSSTPKVQAALEQFNIRNATAIQIGDLYVFSGMTAIDLETFKVSEGTLAEQARMTLETFGLILSDLGLSLDHVVKVNAHLVDLEDFPVWNEVFQDVFEPPYPCRTTVGAPLVVGKIEVEITAATEPRR